MLNVYPRLTIKYIANTLTSLSTIHTHCCKMVTPIFRLEFLHLSFSKLCYAILRNVNFNGNMHMMYLMNSHNNLNFDLCIRKLRKTLNREHIFI